MDPSNLSHFTLSVLVAAFLQLSHPTWVLISSLLNYDSVASISIFVTYISVSVESQCQVSCGGPGSTGRQLPSSLVPHTGPRRGSGSAGRHDIFHLFTYPVCDGLFKYGLCRLEGTYCGPHPFLTSTYCSRPFLLGRPLILFTNTY
jgi:hypothetical protein